MRKIEVIIRPSQLDDAREALSHAWIAGFTVSEVKGYGRQEGHGAARRAAEDATIPVPRLKLEVVVPEPLVPRLVHDLQRHLRTGRTGDGKAFVERVDEAVRVRTGERGEMAL